MENPRFYTLHDGTTLYGFNEAETRFIYNEVFEDRIYLKHGIRFDRATSILDAGANHGVFTLFAAKQNPRAKIYSVEPVPEAYAVLEKNIALHGCDARAIPVALADQIGTATFRYTPFLSTMSSFHSRKGGIRDLFEFSALFFRCFFISMRKSTVRTMLRATAQTLRSFLVRKEATVRLTTVSDLIREYGIESIDLFKLDVEGSELAVLDGIEEGDWPKIKQFVMELHPGILGDDLPARMRELLERKGYEVHVDEGFDPRSVISLYFGVGESDLAGVRMPSMNLPSLYAIRKQGTA